MLFTSAMTIILRPSRLSIEQEFYAPIPLGEGRRVQYNAGAPDQDGPLQLLGYILRWGACYFVAGPDFAHDEQELIQAIKVGRVDHLGKDEVPAARVQRFCSLIEAVSGLCTLIDLAYGPEGESMLECPESDEHEVFDADASPEDPSYAQC